MKLAILAILMALASAARADDEIARGTVVSIQDHEIYFNLGTDQGVTDNAAIRMKRVIHLRHPVTRATIEDWIPIGSGTITEAGSKLSRAVVGKLVTAIQVGDLVEVLIDRPDVRAPTPTTPTPTPTVPAVPEPAVDPAVKEVLAVFVAQVGQPVAARIASWEQYLSTHPSSPFAVAIRRDLEGLAALRDQLKPADSAADAGEVTVGVKHAVAKTATAGEAIPVVVVLDHPGEVASAYLHYRQRDHRTYQRVLLAREHDIYLRGAVPAAVVTAPGVDYFVEVSLPSGQAGLAVASPKEPVRVDIAEAPILDQFGPAPGRSSVKFAVDVLDFATFDHRAGDHTDRMVTATLDFTYLIGKLVQSIGVGYGVYAGQGGFAESVWTDANPIPRSGFHFGYADVELGGDADGVKLGFGGKLIAGVGKTGFGLGAEGRFRIGDREGANLAFVARTIDQVGFLSEIRFGAQPKEHLLVGVSVGATNQPNHGDVAAKLGTELEWIGFSNISLILHGSWQGRTAAHGGIGGGAGLGFYW